MANKKLYPDAFHVRITQEQHDAIFGHLPKNHAYARSEKSDLLRAALEEWVRLKEDSLGGVSPLSDGTHPTTEQSAASKADATNPESFWTPELITIITQSGLVDEIGDPLDYDYSVSIQDSAHLDILTPNLEKWLYRFKNGEVINRIKSGFRTRIFVPVSDDQLRDVDFQMSRENRHAVQNLVDNGTIPLILYKFLNRPETSEEENPVPSPFRIIPYKKRSLFSINTFMIRDDFGISYSFMGDHFPREWMPTHHYFSGSPTWKVLMSALNSLDHDDSDARQHIFARTGPDDVFGIHDGNQVDPR